MRLALFFSCYRLDLLSHVLYRMEDRLITHGAEIRMLAYLLCNNDRVVSDKELHEAISAIPYDRIERSNSLRVHLSRLRALLAYTGDHVNVVSHIGEGIKYEGEVTLDASGFGKNRPIMGDRRVVFASPGFTIHVDPSYDSG